MSDDRNRGRAPEQRERNPKVIAIIVAIVLFLQLVTSSAKVVPGRLQTAGESLFDMIDGVTDSIIGHEGRKYFPFVFSLFLLVLVMNLLGMFLSFTATSQLAVTVTFAALTILLVIGVIFFFLRNVWATIIPACSLPIAIVGSFAFMYAGGYSINMLSLMSLVLAVGFIVDDAIVMLENITRHIEMGKTPMQATLDGSREVTFTILSMTLSLAAVFIPVMFMGGILGRLLRADVIGPPARVRLDAAVLDQLVERAGAGRDDADVNCNRALPSDAVDFLFLNRAQ